MAGSLVFVVAGPATADTDTFSSAQIGTSGNTPQFSENGNWTLSWSYDCSNYGAQGNFIVTINQPANDSTFDVGPNELGSSGSGTDYYTDTGTFSLSIDSECNWSITVAPNETPVMSPPATFTSGQIGSSGESPQFAVGGAWTMAWSYDCSNYGAQGNFIVTINQPPGDAANDAGPNELGSSGSGSDYYTDTGTFSLSIDSECDWSITVSGPPASGYDLVGSDGGVFVFPPPGSSSGFYGSLPGLGVHVNNIVGMVPTSNDQGYFLVGSDGGVFAFGNAPFLGSLPGLGVTPTQPIAGIVPTGNDQGYFLVGRDGGVFAFGNAPFLGSLPGSGVHRSDIIGIAATPSGNGYWLVASDGTVYAFGAAQQLGSATGTTSPVSAIAGTPDGGGYWIVTQNGSVYSFGDAGFFGSLPALGVTPALPVIGIVHTADDNGYWLIGSDGGIFAFGDASFIGSLPGLGVHVTNVVGAVPTES